MRGIATALIVHATGIAQAAGPEDRSRQKININAFWKCQQGDAFEAQAPAFNDAAWQAIDLPLRSASLASCRRISTWATARTASGTQPRSTGPRTAS
jgi:hypothetical protein